MEYPKINTLYKREGCGEFIQEKGRYKSDLERKPRKSPIIEGEYACPEFEAIDRWTITEKVDGTNTRIILDKRDLRYGAQYSLSFHGRTSNAQLPTFLFNYLQEKFHINKVEEVFKDSNYVVLFGEGYGSKIQARSRYRSDPSFVLFDVYCAGWWLDRSGVRSVADALEIDCCSPIPFDTEENIIWNKKNIVDYVKSQPYSYKSDGVIVMEGIVARSEPMMMFRDRPVICEEPLTHANYHIPIMFKLKIKDFQ